PDVPWDRTEPWAVGWRPPALADYAGLLVSGSPESVATPAPWMEEVAELVRVAAAGGRPVLGVCFGHQLLGYAFGARVVRNPRGWELGTQEIALTEAG